MNNEIYLEPEEFVERLKDIYVEYEPFSGGCLKFHLLLHKIYPQAKAFANIDHFVTMIEGKLYDQTGILPPEYLIKNGFTFVDEIELKSIIRAYRDIDSKFIKKGYE